MATIETVLGRGKEGNKTGKISISHTQHNIDTESVFVWSEYRVSDKRDLMVVHHNQPVSRSLMDVAFQALHTLTSPHPVVPLL